MVGVGIDERDLVAGAGEVRAEGSTDRTRAPDEESHRGIRLQPASPHEPVSSARVSSTATFQSASMSSSDRWYNPP